MDHVGRLNSLDSDESNRKRGKKKKRGAHSDDNRNLFSGIVCPSCKKERGANGSITHRARPMDQRRKVSFWSSSGDTRIRMVGCKKEKGAARAP